MNMNIQSILDYKGSDLIYLQNTKKNEQNLFLKYEGDYGSFEKFLIPRGWHQASLNRVAGFINQHFDELKSSFKGADGRDLYGSHRFFIEIMLAYNGKSEWHPKSSEVAKLARNLMTYFVDPNMTAEEREKITRAHKNLGKIGKDLNDNDGFSLLYADRNGCLHRVVWWNLIGRIKVWLKKDETSKVIKQTFVNMADFLDKIKSMDQLIRANNHKVPTPDIYHWNKQNKNSSLCFDSINILCWKMFFRLQISDETFEERLRVSHRKIAEIRGTHWKSSYL